MRLKSSKRIAIKFWLSLAFILSSASCTGTIIPTPELLTTPPILTPGLRADDSPLVQGADITPVYLTLAGHIEDNPRYANCGEYPTYRQQLLDFAALIAASGATLNLQGEYEFFRGVQDCETDAIQASTDGRNVIDYLVHHYGFEIDAHQEGGTDEGSDNYADVHYLGSLATSQISDNVGGMLWDDAAQFAMLETGMQGWLHPDYTWEPEIITLAVARVHHQGDFTQDDQTSGVWIPQGANASFRVHDSSGSLVYVGPGVHHSNWSGRGACDFGSVADYVEVLVDYLQRGDIESGRIYTASLPIPQSVIFSEAEHHKLTAQIEQLAPLIASGHVVYATYSQVVDVWRTRYGSQPSILPFTSIDPADYTCP